MAEKHPFKKETLGTRVPQGSYNNINNKSEDPLEDLKEKPKDNSPTICNYGCTSYSQCKGKCQNDEDEDESDLED